MLLLALTDRSGVRLVASRSAERRALRTLMVAAARSLLVVRAPFDQMVELRIIKHLPPLLRCQDLYAGCGLCLPRLGQGYLGLLIFLVDHAGATGEG